MDAIAKSWVLWAEKELVKHGLHDWKIKPATTASLSAEGYHKATAGYCDWMNKTVGLAKKHLMTACACDIKDTVLHEIAHAKVIMNTPGGYKLPAHGKAWKAAAEALGAVPLAYGKDTCSCPAGG